MLTPVVTVERLHHPMIWRLVTAGVDGNHHIEVDEHLPLAVVIERTSALVDSTAA
jgi:hypothetical protein